jgi:protein-disulfide isomerase
MKRIAPFIIILAVLGIALGSVWYLTRPIPAAPQPAPAPVAQNQPPAPTSSQPATVPASQPATNPGVPGGEPPHTVGPANAPAQLEEFGDFQCPPCGAFHPILEQMEREFGDKLRVTFRNYPLPNHQHAMTAAASAEAAGLQGKFWQMHKLIYEHQKDWKDLFDARPTFQTYAEQIGLDIERFKRDVIGSVVQQRIAQDVKRGQSLGVNGTPTVFLNGREVPFESLPANTLRVLIQREIDNAKK